MQGNAPLTVSLVYKDIPENSTIKNAVLILYDNKDWNEWSCTGYFKLFPHVDPRIVEQTIGSTSVGGMNKDSEDYYRERMNIELTPMKDLYFHSKVISPRAETGNFNTTLALIAIGILVIGIAYINFINFSTALAPLRIKRINTQKVMGAMPSELRRNIIWESVIISVLAFLLSLAWTKLFIATPMADFFAANLFLSNSITILIILGVFAIFMGILAGIYPAYYMTSHPPALVLKGSFALTPKGIKLRNSLLFFQFITTIVLITLAVFIKMQHSFMQNMNPGYDRENVVYIGLNRDINTQRNAFINELMTYPDITDNTFTRFLPGQVGMGWGRTFDGKQVQFTAWPVHHNFCVSLICI
ncbi:MAG: hypothetical protein LIO65_04965 [Odoribacter sp.]|nr:hypothetical protein [Odoribacter sp.]